MSHYVTSWMVAGSITDEVFNRLNPSSRTTALGSTKPLTEMSTTNFPGVKWRPVLHGLLQG
jgi:hypothetical protein